MMTYAGLDILLLTKLRINSVGIYEMTTQNTLGSTLRADRLHAQVTQKDLAQAVSCHFTYLSRIENDHDSPSAALLIRIADHLGVDPNRYLRLAGKEDPKTLRAMVDHLLEKLAQANSYNAYLRKLLQKHEIKQGQQ